MSDSRKRKVVERPAFLCDHKHSISNERSL